jgi:hypothetical protein
MANLIQTDYLHLLKIFTTMSEATAFQNLPFDLINIILEWNRSPFQKWYLKVDEKTGKLCIRLNVRATLDLISANPTHPLMEFLDFASDTSFARCKGVTIHIDGEVFPALEYCLTIKLERNRHYDNEYPELYVAYERNKKMEYLQFTGSCYGQDITNPQLFNNQLLHRFDEARGQYFTQSVYLNHVENTTDYTRQINTKEPIEYFHECKALSNEYMRRRMVDRYARETMMNEMGEEFNAQGKLSMAISLIDYEFNPCSNMYEEIDDNPDPEL